MNLDKLFTTLLAIIIAFNSYGQDLFASVDNSFSSSETVYIYKESINDQENRLVLMLNHILAKSIDYPLEAIENGDEGLVRAVVFFSPDNSKASIKFAKGNLEILESALKEAFNSLNICRFISDDYQGRKAIPIKINFELE